jgi:hypothetical protein
MAGYPAAPPNKWRRRGVKFLLVLASVFAFLSVICVWADDQALDTNNWVSTSGRFLQNDTIRSAVGNFLVDQLYANVNVKQKIGDILPSDVKQIAGPASAGLRNLAGSAADTILETSTAQGLWETANRNAHEQLLAALNNEQGAALTGSDNNEVVLNLGALVNNLVSQIGIGAVQLPSNVGQIVILHGNEIDTARTIYKILKGSALFFVLLTLATLSLAIYLSRGERWVTVLYGGIGLVAAGFADIVTRHVAGGIVVNQLVTNESVKPASSQVWDIGSSLLISVATSLIVIGFLFIIAGWLASPTTMAWRLRRFSAPALQQQTAWVYAGLAVILGIYFLNASTQGLRQFLTTLVIGAMAAFGIEGLRRQTAHEFPDARDSDVFVRARERLVGGAKSLGETASARAKSAGQGARERGGLLIQRDPEPAGDAPAAAGGGASAAAEGAAPAASGNGPPSEEQRISNLERLAALHEKGILSDEEMAAAKARVLSGAEG